MTLEWIKSEIETNDPGCRVEIVANSSPSGQHSLLVAPIDAARVASFLLSSSGLRLDYCSNVTGIDWPTKEVSTKVKTKKIVDGVESEVEEIQKTLSGGYLEAVYHLYSMELKHGPVILRMRTQDRTIGVHLPSLTPVWRSAEFQEREIFDLFGIIFDGHGDLRRLLMWDGYEDHPMRRDYVDPDDYEYEPTAHDEVLRRAKQHLSEAQNA